MFSGSSSAPHVHGLFGFTSSSVVSGVFWTPPSSAAANSPNNELQLIHCRYKIKYCNYTNLITRTIRFDFISQTPNNINVDIRYVNV